MWNLKTKPVINLARCWGLRKLSSMMQESTRRLIKIPFQARHWWLTPVILATQEAEIRRIV
jgi:hypothetical protein